MSAALAEIIREMSGENIQINLWKTNAGNYQANVKEAASTGWTCVIDADPIDGLVKALRQRAARYPGRDVIAMSEPEQIDIEEAIATATTVAEESEECEVCCGTSRFGCEVCDPTVDDDWDLG